MNLKDKKYFHSKIVVLRKSLQMLEEELGLEVPTPPKRKKNSFKEYLEKSYAERRWCKPESLKTKKALAGTKAS